jgi:hypothetical protein
MMNSFDDSDQHFGSHDQIQPGWDFAELVEQLGHSIFSSHTENGAIVGTPGTDTHDWVHQTTPFTCDVVSQEMILHEYGVNASEAQLTYDAASHGWLTDGGTSPQDMAQLLEFHGVPTHTNYNGSIDALTSELAHGHKVIVAVDSSELWNTASPVSSWFNSHTADHAIVVTGLDMSDSSHPKVLVNDPGDPQGAGKPYPLDQFLEAWGGSGNMYVATDSAPPHLADHSTFGANFHPDQSGLGGMYMNSAYWTDFLKGLGAVVARGWLQEHAIHGHPNSETDTTANPWENMTGAERNDLFVKI